MKASTIRIRPLSVLPRQPAWNGAYIRDRDFIARCREKGDTLRRCRLVGHVACRQPKGDADYAAQACVNLRGEPVAPPGSSLEPAGQLVDVRQQPCARTALHGVLESVPRRRRPGYASATSPRATARPSNWGACFCDHCMRRSQDPRRIDHDPAAAAMGIGDIETFNYRELLLRQNAAGGRRLQGFDGGDLKRRFAEFQEAANARLSPATRQALNEHAGRKVAFSCNNGCRRWTPVELAFDWCFGELSFRHATPDFLHQCMLQATSLERHQVVTMPKKSDRDNLEGWCRLTRQTVAMAYACGGHAMVPWDVYMPGDAPRYFGTPEQYADLFGFIRANAKYLDGYEYAGAVGAGLSCDLYGDRTPIELNGGEGVCAVLRTCRAKLILRRHSSD